MSVAIISNPCANVKQKKSIDIYTVVRKLEFKWRVKHNEVPCSSGRNIVLLK